MILFVFIVNTKNGWSMDEDISKVLVRMPAKLKEALREKAREECRSFNSEVVKRLIDSLKAEGFEFTR